MSGIVIHWFRRDLRLTNHSALAAASQLGERVLPVFVNDGANVGSASRWWLHQSLEALSHDIAAQGGRLIVREGAAAEVLRELVEETGATALTFTRRYEDDEAVLEREIAGRLGEMGVEVKRYGGSLLHEPEALETKSGGPFRVFTPFYKAGQERGVSAPRANAPPRFVAPEDGPVSVPLEALNLLPTKPDWAGGLRATWRPGEAGARERLTYFLENAVTGYADDRNRPDKPATSRLSPYLHFGEISPRVCVEMAESAARQHSASVRGAESFVRELYWREFSYHLLFHNPDLATRPLQSKFAAFPWREDRVAEEAWRRGRTGYPIVDAGMRELWETGWMHNRVRMIVASFLIKDLLIPWTQGLAWFHDTLVDADAANNAASWQWVAGCGADAAPYFRVFNPVLQGEKFDPEGDYVRRYVPELKHLPAKSIHKPWTASEPVPGYPDRIVDHAAARAIALEAYGQIKSSEGT